MLISVVIPHLNQEEDLRAGLAALHAQQGASGPVEIIVVDNGSRRLPAAVCAGWPGVTLLAEPTPGPGPARNRGVRAATGAVLAFIDADCRAAPGWLAAIEAAFADPATAIIGGDVRVGYRDPGRPSFLEPYEAIYSYRNSEHIAAGFSGTGNLAVRPEAMARVGPFAGIAVAEDRDWGLRAGACGYRIRYVPEMVVYHPARSSFAELARKWDRHVAHDHALFAARRFGRVRWLGRAVAVAGSPLFELPTILRSPRVASPRERWLALLCLARIRLYRGRAMLRRALGRADRRPAAWNRD